MRERLKNLLNVRSGEWGLVLSLLALLALNTMVLQISNVVATAGFVSEVGTRQIPWLWIVDMVITLFSAGLYAMIIDRVPRVQFTSWLLIGFTFFYLLIFLLFNYGVSEVLTYPLLYLLADQQYIIFPLAFWSLANDVYTMAQSRRLFPVIAAGAAVGSIIGNGLAAGSAAIFADQGGSTTPLLVLSAFVFLIGFVLIQLVFRNREVRARQSQSEDSSIRETLKVGFDVIRNVPLFSYLAIAMFLVGLSLTVVEYHFIFTMDLEFSGDPLGFQTFYGIYKAALIVTTWLFQWLVTGRLLQKLDAKNTFFVFPVVLTMSVAGAFAILNIVGGAGARFVARLFHQAWDEPARKAAQNLIPDERRGRVSAFLDSYFYAGATIVGCIILLVLLLISSLGLISEEVMIRIYLILAGLASLASIWATLRIRKVYEKSLLNWRLSRSRRKSILDGIEF